MKITITGRVICAGKLKDGNGDEFHGVMIDTGKDQLTNKAIPFYHTCSLIPILSSAESIFEWLQTGISNQQYHLLAEMMQYNKETP